MAGVSELGLCLCNLFSGIPTFNFFSLSLNRFGLVLILGKEEGGRMWFNLEFLTTPPLSLTTLPLGIYCPSRVCQCN